MNNLNSLIEINDSIKTTMPNSKFIFDDLITSLNASEKVLNDSYFGFANVLAMQQTISDNVDLYQKASEAIFIVPGKTTLFVNDDELVVNDSLKLADNTLYRKINPFRFVSYGGTRIDFALGFAVTAGNLNSTSYFITRNSAGKAVGLGESRENSIANFSPIAFVHITFKSASVLSPAISVGLNPDFSTVSNSRLLVGFSGAFTESNTFLKRLVFSVGLGVGLTDALKPKYGSITSDNADQLLSSLSDGDLTEKAVRFGEFFSVSFNLGQLNKK